MSDTHTPPAEDTDALAPIPDTWQGTKLVGATIEIGGTGAGLEKGLVMAPVQVVPGHHVDVVLRCRLDQHRVKYLDEDGDRGTWVNRLTAEHATIVGSGDIASRALDDAEKTVAERKSEAERRKREEAGEVPLPLFDDDDARGGDPASVGDVLDDVIGTLGDVEDDDAWRDGRREELKGWTKGSLETELTDVHSAEAVASDLTKAELVELVLDHEGDGRG